MENTNNGLQTMQQVDLKFLESIELQNKLIIENQHILQEKGLGLRVYLMPKPDFSGDHSVPVSKITDITNTHLWVRPYFNPLYFKQHQVYHCSTAYKASARILYGDNTSGWNPGFYSKPIANAGLNKIVAIGNIDVVSNSTAASYSHSEITYQTGNIDYDGHLSFVISFIVGYMGEFESRRPSGSTNFLVQDATYHIRINEFTFGTITPNPVEVYDSNPIRLYEFDSRLTTFNQSKLGFSRNFPATKEITVTVKSGHYYELTIGVYAYSWTDEGKAAMQTEMQIIPFM